jgi:hypothetical protein
MGISQGHVCRISLMYLIRTAINFCQEENSIIYDATQICWKLNTVSAPMHSINEVVTSGNCGPVMTPVINREVEPTKLMFQSAETVQL